jgi:hypothetical protein
MMMSEHVEPAAWATFRLTHFSVREFFWRRPSCARRVEAAAFGGYPAPPAGAGDHRND